MFYQKLYHQKLYHFTTKILHFSIEVLQILYFLYTERYACMHTFLVTHSCLTLCNPMDCSPPGSPVHGIFQARILEWVPFSSPGDLPSPGIEPRSPLQADFLPTELQGNFQKLVKGKIKYLSCMCYTGIARILEWVAFPLSRGSSQPKDWTQVSHIVGRFFTSWPMTHT